MNARVGTSHPDLAGELVVVIGGAGRIGSAVCTELSSHGAKVLAVDTNDEALRRMANDATEPYVCDVTQPVERAALEDVIAARTPRYFVAALNRRPVYGGQVPDPVLWAANYDLYTATPMVLANAVLVARHDRGMGGSAVLLSSIHARTVERYITYTAAKAALEMAARELAFAVGKDGSRVNVVAPGHVQPEVGFSRATRLRQQSVPRAAVAASVRFLLCDDCSPATTGAVLDVDGGLKIVHPWE